MRKFYLLLFIIWYSCQYKSSEPTAIDLNESVQECTLFGKGIISTPLYERDMAISPGGDEVIYTLGNQKQTIRCLVHLKLENDVWTNPTILPFSGKYHDIEPAFSNDGKQLYFASSRPMDGNKSRSDYNIWVVEKKEEVWGEPQPLDTFINTSGDEFYPSLASNGNLYFTATRSDGIGREDIFVSKAENGKFGIPAVLDSNVNTTHYEFNAYIHPEENLIIFSSYGRPEDLGGGDLYYSIKDSSGMWQPSKNMGPDINSVSLDYCPFIDTKTGHFYFTSDRTNMQPHTIKDVDELRSISNDVLNGFGNIYRINMDALSFPQ